jgi:hypothetical protein
MVCVSTVRHVHDFVLEIAFDDGCCKQIDMTPYLRGPIFEPLRNDPVAFASVSVDPELGTICWPNGADVCPDVLRDDLTPAAWHEPPGGASQ